MVNQKLPPGWYPHPTMAGTQRYWDGAKWTDHVAPLAAASQTARNLPGRLGDSGVDIGKDRQDRTPRDSMTSNKVMIGVGGILVIVTLAAVLLLRGGGHDIEGSVVVVDGTGPFDITRPTCSASGLSGGSEVRVSDGSGKTLGVGTLGVGEPGTPVNSSRSEQCVFKFTVSDVDKADFYQFTIGEHDGPSYSYDDLEANDWQVDMSIS